MTADAQSYLNDLADQLQSALKPCIGQRIVLPETADRFKKSVLDVLAAQRAREWDEWVEATGHKDKITLSIKQPHDQAPAWILEAFQRANGN